MKKQQKTTTTVYHFDDLILSVLEVVAVTDGAMDLGAARTTETQTTQTITETKHTTIIHTLSVPSQHSRVCGNPVDP